MRGIDLKIDDIWGLDLSMTGRAHAFRARHFNARIRQRFWIIQSTLFIWTLECWVNATLMPNLHLFCL